MRYALLPVVGTSTTVLVSSEVALRDGIDQYYGTTTAIELKKVMDDISAIDGDEEAADLEVMEDEEEIRWR